MTEKRGLSPVKYAVRYVVKILDPRTKRKCEVYTARPGLSLQIANQKGLLPRLRAVEAERPGELSTRERIQPGQDNAQRHSIEGKC